MSGALDAVNRAVWSSDVARFDWDGWSDAGERIATTRLAGMVRDRPILDLGVGTGRTIPLLRSLSADYTAIDYTPAMVAECRRRFPSARVLEMDARDLSVFPDSSFGLVTFSLNGIDAVDHAGREQILAEVHRVLQPGGVFHYSTHNLLGAGPRQRPWRLPHIDVHKPRATLRRVRERTRHPARAWRNYRRLAPLVQAHGQWAFHVDESHEFGIIVHFVSVAGVIAELRSAGFAPEVELYDTEGQVITPASDVRNVWYFQVVAFKPR